jgi:hypothetical protein
MGMTLQFGDDIRRLVSRHLEDKLIETEVTAGHLKATHINRAKKIASKYLYTRLGTRLSASRGTEFLDTAAAMIGINRTPHTIHRAATTPPPEPNTDGTRERRASGTPRPDTPQQNADMTTQIG